MDHPQDITDADFPAFLAQHRVAIIDCWAPWCGPCKRIAPILEEMAREYAGQLAIGKLNTDENPQTPMRFGVMSIPTLLLFKDGRLVSQVVGAVPKKDLVARVGPLLAGAGAAPP
jgi:thioredoxin